MHKVETFGGGWGGRSREQQANMDSSTGGEHGAAGGASDGLACHKCKTIRATYESAPCGCSKFCVACARKLATGGKCKVSGSSLNPDFVVIIVYWFFL